MEHKTAGFYRNRVLSLAILLFCAAQAYAQGAPGDRHNRIQYHKYDWVSFPTPLFHLYFPKGYEGLADFISLQFPDVKREQEKALGGGFRQIPNIVIYPSPDQYLESNIGKSEGQKNGAPTISLKGNRIVLYFNGSHGDLRQQLKLAMVRMGWEDAFKSDLEVFEGNNKVSRDDWYKEGCIAYFAEGWPLGKENMLKGIFEKGQAKGLQSLVREDPALFGQAFCYFLSLKYRRDADKQIFFQLRDGKNLKRAARLVAKRPLDTLMNQCFSFYRKRFGDAPYPVPMDLLRDSMQALHPKGKVLRVLASPEGRTVASLVEESGNRKVYLSSGAYPKGKIIKKYALPPWLADHTDDPYPLMQWAEGNTLWLAMPVKGVVQAERYNVNGGLVEREKLYGVEGLNSFVPLKEGKLLLSAYRKGKSDIVVYEPRRLRYTALTDDPADDLELAVSESGQRPKVVYRSGYPADSLAHKDNASKRYGLYYKNYTEGKFGKGLEETLLVADSGNLVWHEPFLLADGQVVIRNSNGGRISRDTFRFSDGGTVPLNPAANTPSPWLRERLALQREADSVALIEQGSKGGEPSFLSRVLIPEGAAAASKKQGDSLRKALRYDRKKTKPYLLQLHAAYFSVGIDNDYYINRYQPFQSYLGAFKFPEVGAMVGGGYSDLFENHHFNAGYRMPSGTEGSDFFFRYGNTKRKTDWHLLYFRKVESLQPDPERGWKDEAGNPYPAAAKVNTHYYELGFHFPLSYDASLDFRSAFRDDRTVFLATDRYALNFENLKQRWSINTLSYSVDKKQAGGILFLHKGWDMKLLLDGMVEAEKPSTMLYGIQLQYAKYQPLAKGVNLEGRFKAGYSGGESRILYNFGGLDNNVVPRVDSSVHFAQDAPYAFQTLVTPFRGYPQNSIYGNAYALLNLDVYFPVFATLVPLETGFASVNNLQVGLFTDMVSTAKTGRGFSGEGDFREAYGFSARTLLAGYAIRFDMAWQGSFVGKPVWYLSLGF